MTSANDFSRELWSFQLVVAGESDKCYAGPTVSRAHLLGGKTHDVIYDEGLFNVGSFWLDPASLAATNARKKLRASPAGVAPALGPATALEARIRIRAGRVPRFVSPFLF